MLQKINRLSEPIPLAGDFNLRPDDPMKSVIANRGLVDTWTTVKDSEDGVTTRGARTQRRSRSRSQARSVPATSVGLAGRT